MVDWDDIRRVMLDYGPVGGRNLREKLDTKNEAAEPLESIVQEKQQIDRVISHMLPAMHWTSARYINMVYNPEDPRFLDPERPTSFMSKAAIKEWYFAFEGVQFAQEQGDGYQSEKLELLDEMRDFEQKYILSGIPEENDDEDICRVILDRRTEFIEDMTSQIKKASEISNQYGGEVEELKPAYLKARNEVWKQGGISVAGTIALAYVGGKAAHAAGSLFGPKVGKAIQTVITAAKNSHMG